MFLLHTTDPRKFLLRLFKNCGDSILHYVIRLARMMALNYESKILKKITCGLTFTREAHSFSENLNIRKFLIEIINSL